jgi:hypothetical protein
LGGAFRGIEAVDADVPTAAPSLTKSRVTNPALPIAAIRMSARRQTSRGPRPRVASHRGVAGRQRAATGFPDPLRPRTTACLDRSSVEARRSRGGAGNGRPCASSPRFRDADRPRPFADPPRRRPARIVALGQGVGRNSVQRLSRLARWTSSRRCARTESGSRIVSARQPASGGGPERRRSSRRVLAHEDHPQEWRRGPASDPLRRAPFRRDLASEAPSRIVRSAAARISRRFLHRPLAS